MSRWVAALSLLAMLAASAMAQTSRVELACPGPTGDTGDQLFGDDRAYGITDTVGSGENRTFCRDIKGVVNVTAVRCRLKPYQEAPGWLCTSGQPCAGVTFGRVVFDVSGSGPTGSMHECVTVQNASRWPRGIQIGTTRQ